MRKVTCEITGATLLGPYTVTYCAPGGTPSIWFYWPEGRKSTRIECARCYTRKLQMVNKRRRSDSVEHIEVYIDGERIRQSWLEEQALEHDQAQTVWADRQAARKGA